MFLEQEVCLKMVKIKEKKNNQKGLNDFYESTNITPQKQKIIDQALTRTLVCCGLPFSLVENPFFIEFVNQFNQLKPAYKLPSRFKLTKDFINEEVANVNVKVEFELKRQNNITLGKEIISIHLLINWIFYFDIV